jgi:biotin carboxyl carrier protein
LKKEFIVTLPDQEIVWELRHEEEYLLNGELQNVAVHRLPDGRVSILLNGRSFLVDIESENGRQRARIKNQSIELSIESAEFKLLRTVLGRTGSDTTGVEIKAPMPGLVAKIEVVEGQRISAGAGLVILEAMKMENELRAPISGTIAKIFISEKATVEKGQSLLTITKD